MTKRRGSRTPTVRVVWFVAAMALATSACSGGTQSLDDGSASNSALRDAGKETCLETVPGWVPSGLELSDRRLVPFSQTLLGVDAEYRADGRFLRVVSGGYLDDVLEPYDDLAPLETQPIDGAAADVLGGTFLGVPVFAATWKAPGVVPPCSTRVVVAVGLAKQDFDSILAGLAVRSLQES